MITHPKMDECSQLRLRSEKFDDDDDDDNNNNNNYYYYYYYTFVIQLIKNQEISQQNII